MDNLNLQSGEAVNVTGVTTPSTTSSAETVTSGTQTPATTNAETSNSASNTIHIGPEPFSISNFNIFNQSLMSHLTEANVEVFMEMTPGLSSFDPTASPVGESNYDIMNQLMNSLNQTGTATPNSNVNPPRRRTGQTTNTENVPVSDVITSTSSVVINISDGTTIGIPSTVADSSANVSGSSNFNVNLGNIFMMLIWNQGALKRGEIILTLL